MTVGELCNQPGFNTVVCPSPNREITGVYIGDLLSWVMGRAPADSAWVTIMSNINVIAVATLADTSCIILAEGVTLDSEVKMTAEQKSINVLTSELSAYEIALRLNEKI